MACRQAYLNAIGLCGVDGTVVLVEIGRKSSRQLAIIRPEQIWLYLLPKKCAVRTDSTTAPIPKALVKALMLAYLASAKE